MRISCFIPRTGVDESRGSLLTELDMLKFLGLSDSFQALYINSLNQNENKVSVTRGLVKEIKLR